MTGFSISFTGSTAEYGNISIYGSSTAVRWDHCHMNDNVGGGHTFQVDAVNGVWDHNVLESTNNQDIFMIQMSNNGANNNGNEIWAEPDQFGSSNYVFFENDLIQNVRFADDCDYGGRFTLRYSTMINSALQSHGVGSGQQRRGCRANEVYMNNFSWPGNGTNEINFVNDFESGDGMWWGNTVTDYGILLREDNIRANTATYPAQATPPNGWGQCGTSATGVASSWDENLDSTGNACLDQPGRGQGDLLTSEDFPGITNSVLGGQTWPRQVLTPIYIWGNTGPATLVSNYDSYDPFVANRDYFVQTTSFNGTSGVGCGPTTGTGCPANAVAQPSTCSVNTESYTSPYTPSTYGPNPGVGYWNVTNQTLYVCTAVNTWTAYYTPYTYPHPLDVSSNQSASPTISPTSGSVPQTVTISEASSGNIGTVICYNTTGSPATNGDGATCASGSTKYTAALNVTIAETLYAVAGLSGHPDSSVVTGTYSVSPPTGLAAVVNN